MQLARERRSKHGGVARFVAFEAAACDNPKVASHGWVLLANCGCVLTVR